MGPSELECILRTYILKLHRLIGSSSKLTLSCLYDHSDVSFFVAPGTKLDEEARFRATTVYLVQKVPILLHAITRVPRGHLSLV